MLILFKHYGKKRRQHNERKSGGKKYELRMLSNFVKIKSRHANSRIKVLLREIKNTTKYLQSTLKFSYALFSEFLAR